MKLVIYGSLPGLNEYTKVSRGNKYASSTLKKETEQLIRFHIKTQRIQPISCPVRLFINWYEKDMRRDADNIIFAKKFILDALVAEGILMNDSRKYVVGFVEDVLVDKKNPRIEVELVDQIPSIKR